MVKSKAPRRLVGYTRVSTEDQAREGVSLEAQHERLAAYAVAHGVELVDVESDAGVSGLREPGSRNGLSRALQRIRNGEADGLVVLKLDRLSRSTRHVLDLVDECRRGDWRLVSVSESLDTGTAAGRLVVTVLAALAEMEREQVAERTSEALSHLARRGRVYSHRIPFGWRTESGLTQARAGERGRLVEHAEEQQLLALILCMRSSGAGAKKIANALGTRRLLNPRTGRPWTAGTVASLLRTAERRQARALAR